MTDLETGLLATSLVLLFLWVYSLLSHSETKDRLNDYRQGVDNLGKFEPKLLKAFGARRVQWADWHEVIDVDEVNRLGKVGNSRLKREQVEEDYQRALRILRDDQPITANPPE